MLCTFFAAAAANGHDIPREMLFPHLFNKDNGVRRAALHVMTQGLDQSARATLLDELATATPRFYDVVGILDRMVHGPAFAQARARTVLEEA